jgi:hypothetical protein
MIVEPTSLVVHGGIPGVATSGVTRRLSIVADTARSMARASTARFNECRRSIATLRIAPMGFAMPRPAMSGADPWIGS